MAALGEWTLSAHALAHAARQAQPGTITGWGPVQPVGGTPNRWNRSTKNA